MCVSFACTPTQLFQRQETWRNAETQGRHAALNLLGGELPFEGVPGFWSDQYDWGLQTVGVISPTPPSAVRTLADGGLLLFSLDTEQRLQGTCGWGAGQQRCQATSSCVNG